MMSVYDVANGRYRTSELGLSSWVNMNLFAIYPTEW
jgi:hypothetical protein